MSSGGQLYILHVSKNEPKKKEANHLYIVKPEGTLYRKDVLPENIRGEPNSHVKHVQNSKFNLRLVFHDAIDIGAFAFAGMQNIKAITFTEAYKQEYKIGEHAFDSCFNLENVNYSTYDDTTVSFGECCFKNCRSLNPFDLPVKLTIRVNAFDGCSDECRVNMLQQISDPRFEQTIYFPILTNEQSATQELDNLVNRLTERVQKFGKKNRYEKLTEEPVFRL